MHERSSRTGGLITSSHAPYSSLGDLKPAEFKLQEMEETVSIKRRYNYAHDEDQELM
jgi:hypothetical protein